MNTEFVFINVPVLNKDGSYSYIPSMKAQPVATDDGFYIKPDEAIDALMKTKVDTPHGS